MTKKFFKISFNVVVYIFAAIGLFLMAGYFAVKFGLTNEKGIVDTQRDAFLGIHVVPEKQAGPAVPWKESEEWEVLSAALTRDQATLNKAANDSGVPARLIAANLVAEQLRLFFTEREYYKQFFSPLKILGSQTQFSWGVMGMKENTAIKVEAYLKDPSSPFYPGPQYEHLLDFETSDIEGERFTRMTDQHNHYWSYLYAGLYIKEIEAQWRTAGFPIDGNVAILSTLYNIGFTHSNPNPDPQVGGAAITAGDKTFSFGGLAADFYNSDLLTAEFPK
ncbi:MAG: hypothetical protein AB203_01985 [Parcubacteria bacterium C7867-008]|nr:MAG: hypothetical protein AB203_01985 [Parcubacteria bacterium C7867-008]